MSAKDELRRMLDEAGVEWTDCSYKDTCTAWSSNGITWYGLWRDGSIELLAHHLTPAQAIAATVGRGTCHKVLDFDGTAWICSECGEHIGPRRWNFCPNCGRKVVDE